MAAGTILRQRTVREGFDANGRQVGVSLQCRATRYSSFSGLLPLARMEPSGSTDKVVPRVDLASTGLSRVQLRDGRSAFGLCQCLVR